MKTEWLLTKASKQINKQTKLLNKDDIKDNLNIRWKTSYVHLATHCNKK